MSRCAGHEPDRFPDVRAATCLPVHRRPVARRRRVRSGAAPRAAGAVGADRPRWRWSRSAASARCCTPGCGCSCRPSGTPTPLAPGLDAATRQGKRGGRRERRLADYGPLVAVGAIAIGVLLLVTLATGQSLSFGPLLLAGAGVAVLWWQADEAQRQRWLDPSRRMNPLRAIVGGGGWRAWLRIVAGLMLLIAAIVLFSLRSGSLSVALNVGLAAAFGILGLGFMVGPVAAAAVLRPQRGARGAGALGGARRRRRPPARLGAPDPGADPALGRRPGHGHPAGPRAGARPPVLALRRHRRGPGHARGRAARRRGRGRGRARRPRRGGLRRRRPGHPRRTARSSSRPARR